MRLRITTACGMVISAAFAAMLIAASGGASGAASSGLAYDELTRTVMSSPIPTPGSFPADFQAAIDAQRAAAGAFQQHGLISIITHAQSNANHILDAMTKGSPSSVYYLNAWQRTDDPAKQTATIFRPDKKQIIYLDLAKKTYRIADMGTSTPPPANQPPSAAQGPTPAPEPGTGKLDVTESASIIGPTTIDNVPTTGYDEAITMVASQSTGSCRDGTFQMSMKQYISNYVTPGGHVSADQAFKMIGSGAPQGNAMGCAPKITNHHTGSVTVPTNRLSLWTEIVLKGNGPPSGGAPNGGSFRMIVERGNVRTLGPGDAGLFDIPAGFTQQQQQ